jgi:hypothetical protein
MSFFQNYGTKRRLAHLTDTWNRLRGYLEADPSGASPGSEDAFLELKKDIGQGLTVLFTDFGSPSLNREAEQAAGRIRNFLNGIPTLASLRASQAKDPEGLHKAWHGVFLVLSELSGAKLPKATKPVVARSPIMTGSRMPYSGSPSYRRHFRVFGWVGPLIGVIFKVAAFVAILSIALFFAEKSGFFGGPAQTGQTGAAGTTGGVTATTNPVLKAIGQGWQSAQNWARTTFPTFYSTLHEYYKANPDTGVIILVAVGGLFLGYLLFIRIR